MSNQAVTPVPEATRARATASSVVSNVTVSLQPGWNAVGLQCQRVSALTANPAVAGVAYYEPAGYVTRSLTSEVLNAGGGGRRGFFAFANSATSFTYSGSDEDSVIDLVTGYNLVSFTTSADLPGSSVSGPVGSTVLPTFFQVNADNSQTPVNVQQGGTLRAGRPYWVFASAPARLSLAGTPQASPTPQLTALAISPANLTLQRYSAGQLQASGNGVDVTNLAQWSSSEPSVAAVGPTGLVTGLFPGQATITARYVSLVDNITVTVTDNAPPPVLPSPTPPPVQDLYVTEQGTSTIRVFARSANGNVPPLRVIGGGATLLDDPRGPALDPSTNELFVASTNSPAIMVFPLNGSGNIAPVRTIFGPATRLNQPAAVALDRVNGEIFVADLGSRITVYPRTGSGNIAPLREISGAATGLATTGGVSLDPITNEILVTNLSGSILTFNRTDNGNVAPLRNLSGAATGLSVPFALGLDLVNNEFVVPNFGDNSLGFFPRTATGNVPPTRTVAGAATTLVNPISLQVSPLTDEIVVPNYGGARVTVFSRTASGNVAPLRTISGAATGLTNPTSVNSEP